MKTILSNVLSTLVCTAFMHIRAKGDSFNCWTTVLPGIYGEENLPRIDQAGFYYNDQVLQAAQYSQRTSFFGFVETEEFTWNGLSSGTSVSLHTSERKHTGGEKRA